MWVTSLLLLTSTLTAAVSVGQLQGLLNIPSLDEIIVKGAALVAGTYNVTGSCDAVLESDEDACTVSISGDPEGCLKLNILAGKLFGSGSKTTQDIVKSMPSSTVIESIQVDVCNKGLEMTVTSNKDLEVVPEVITLSNVHITVQYTVSSKQLNFDISGTWQIGQISFSVSASKNEDGISLSGQTDPASKEFNIGEIITAMGSNLISENTVSAAVNAIGLNSLRLKDLSLESVFADGSYDVRFSFSGISSVLGNPTIYITMNNVNDGDSSSKGITIAGSFSNLQVASLFKTLTTLDISGVPFVGNAVFDSLDMMYSNYELGDPLIEYRSEGLSELTPVIKGTQILTDIKFSSNGSPSQVKITVSESLVKFEILSDKGISVKTFIDKLISSPGNIALPPNFNLNSFLALTITGFEYDPNTKIFVLPVKSPDPIIFVPNSIELDNAIIVFSVRTGRTAVTPQGSGRVGFDFSGTWQIGQISFSVSASKNGDGISLSGQTDPASKEFNIGEIITAMGSNLISENTVSAAVNAIGLNSLRLKDLSLESVFADGSYDVRFSFSGISSVLGNPTIYITMNNVNDGDSSSKGITIAGSFSNLQVASLFKTLTTLDISGVPFVGNAVFDSLDMMYSNYELGDPLIEYTSVGLSELTPVIKGTQILTDIKFSSNGSPSQVKITVSESLVKFEILSDSGISVKTFIDKLISSLGNIALPPNFNLNSFLALTLTSFEYDPNTKIFVLPVELPDPIIFVPNAIELDNATIVFSVRTGRTAVTPQRSDRVGFKVECNWRLGKLVIPLKIGKPLGLSVFLAESRPDIDIPFGKLIEKFLVALLPSRQLENAVKKAGFGSFHITKPYVQIYFGSDTVVKVAGTATIGSWDKCNVEVMIGQVSGSFVMATGIVLTDVPITKLIKKITDGTIDMTTLPGASIFDATDVAVSMSSQNVPKTQKFMQFTIPALSDVEILDGVSLLTAFKFPEDCSDRACRTFKKLLGPDAKLVLKGRLHLASFKISATVPTNIQIYRNINITDVGIEIEMGTRNAIGIKGTLAIPNPALTFIGGFGISTSGVYLDMSMKGWWDKPFGVPFFGIGNLHIRASIVPDPGVLSAIEFGGQGKLGLIGNKNAEPLKVSMYCGIDRYSASENFFQGSFTKLTIQSLLLAFAYKPSLPKPLAEIGFPKGLNTSFALKTKVLSNGITVQRGYFLQGMLKVLFFEAFADVKLNLNGIFVNLTVNPFNVANGLVQVTGRSSSMGPRLFVDIGWNPLRAFINIEGKIKVLAISAYTNITVDHRGMSFEVSGSFLNLFEAGLKIRANYKSIQTAEFQVQGYFKQQLFDELEEKVSNALNDYKRNADEAIKNANNELSNAQGLFDDASEKVASAQHTLENQKEHFNSVNRNLEKKKKDLKDKKRAWDSAVTEMRNAQRTVADKQRSFLGVIQHLQNKQRNSCPDACRKRRAIREDIFMNAPQAKEFIRKKRAPRVKRGWGWRGPRIPIPRIPIPRIKNPVEVTREAAEKVREQGEKAREITERGVEFTKCTTIMAARELCIKGLQAAELAVRGAQKSLDVARATLSITEKVVDESRGVMDVAAGLVSVAQGVVSAAKVSLDAAKLAVEGAAAVVKNSKFTLDAAKGVMTGVMHVNRFGVKISQVATQFLLTGMFRINKIEFDVKIAAAQSGHFTGSMTARFLYNTETFDFTIKLMSVGDMVKVLVEKVKDTLF